MFRATLKSLLGRKLRLLMSTFAIVLGVAFVGGSLIFSDTLGRELHGAVRLDGRRRRRPSRRRHRRRRAVLGGDPCLGRDADLQSVPGAARVDGNVTAFGVYVVDKDNKVVGGQGPPAIGGSYSDAPAGHGLPGLTLDRRAGRRTDPTRSCFDAKTAERSGYFVGEKVHIVTAADQALLTPTAGRAGRASPTAAR